MFSLSLSSLLNHRAVTVSPLPVDILDSSTTKPNIEPSGLDAGRCDQHLCSREDVESEELCCQRQEGHTTRCFVRLRLQIHVIEVSRD